MFKDAGFYIMWAIFSIFPLTIAIFSPDKIRTKIIAALCVLAVTFGIMVIMYKQADDARVRWNDGICNCGGTYELVAVSGRGSSKDYYYSCDACGHTKEFDNLMK